MVKLVGPLMSLSASGTFSKDLNFFYGPSGPVARRVKRSFTPPGQIWFVNQEYFKQANVRWSTLTSIQKEAWKVYFEPTCDTPRDRFIGKQIEMWNIHPTNDITWPQVELPDIQWSESEIYHSVTQGEWYVYTGFKEEDYYHFQMCGMRWYNSNNFFSCDESDFLKETVLPYTKFKESEITKNYFWVKAIRTNGSLSDFHKLT
jgi:hypothetical protein